MQYNAVKICECHKSHKKWQKYRTIDLKLLMLYIETIYFKVIAKCAYEFKYLIRYCSDTDYIMSFAVLH